MAKILVVDDEVQVRDLLREALSAAGHEAVTVPTPEQAAAVLAGQPLDLVVLDLSFPGGSGAAFLQAVRRARSDMPVVVYSGIVTGEMDKELRRAGANEVLTKTAGVVTLVKQIGKILQAKARMFQDPAARRPGQLLIVDDESSVRHLLREFFEGHGYRVLEAESGEQAVRIAQQERPAVALLDVMMPGMDGLQTLAKLREVHPAMGVVMATGQQDDQTVRKAVELGAYSYVLKPFDLLYLELVVLSKLIIAESGN